MIARSHVTLEDVAQEANVSLATASRVLNGTTNVREDLRDRVLAAATDLAYTPNVHAQALAGASHPMVGVVCHDVSDPYFAAVARGVLRVADRNGLLVMLASTFHDPEKEIAYVSTLRRQRASAIVLAGSAFEDRAWERALSAELEPYRRGGGQVAVIGRHRNLRADSVQPENRSGAKALAAALAGLGHRRFAVLTGPRTLTTVVDRFTGFREGLAEAGVELSEGDVFEGAFSRDGGHAAARELLAAGHKATCVFAVSDEMAIGAMTALREAGRSVPDDVSVAGFGNIPVAQDLNPALTTVTLPLEDLGEQVMELALSGTRGGRSRVRRMGGEVVLRESTARTRRRR
ncbi:LacI family transcriptional regulator [Amycolatopsis bartoniae]|uniref:LacI family transcriptional regulator n=1 Tax=Amycolatopsis bartoniae TaxID=941986 RepID=A0A8H9J0Y3_9PSEU|nr:LacI family DNA-binding transcriptional regulator [Amycolatopsis bartoniae]MBB2934190.1 LacI family transcriptional regulator [Amycolatopsis bartoniae]TVT08697.1 LacI family transcriptional regulator [Amycolatopsis bartoniae]GHF88574.1 LacI family transcriptional regulator [Amycolatopsis bartoniae]